MAASGDRAEKAPTSARSATRQHGAPAADASQTPQTPQLPNTTHIHVLYFALCPHTPRALAIVHDILRAEGVESDVEMIPVETEEAAELHQFYGSPTIRVDGEDVRPAPAGTGATPSLACRLYLQPDGRLAPHPPADAIAAALHRTGRGRLEG
jgi:hypothetical protein